MSIYHEKTAVAAMGKWKGVLMELGVPAALLSGKHGPCPVCGGTDRFRFDNKERSGSSICNVCGARSGMKLAQDFTGMSFPEVASRIDQILGNIKVEDKPSRPPMTDEERRAALRRIYIETRPIHPGDVAHTYLASRHIEELIYPKTLRFHPALRDGAGGIRPAMVAMIGVHGEPRFCSMHRTFLRPDGKAKAEMESPRKLMPGELPEGACVMLSEWTGSGAIGIAEGIETAMAASALHDMPVWAAISAPMLTKWRPPPGAEEVVIFGDNDPKFGGQSAAYRLAHAIATAKDAPVVSVHIPPVPGTDWADELAARKGKPPSG